MESKESSIKEVLSLFIEYPIYDSNDENIDNHVQKLINALGKNEEVCKNYSAISKTIYSLNDKDFTNLKMFFGIEGEDHFSNFSGSSSLDSTGKDNLQHFWRHVVLSCYQRKYIDNITKNVKEEADEARSKVNGIYSEFVGILGVFTALSFALMGSVQVFGNILKNINNPTMGNIGYVLVVGGLYLILIYLITMTLFLAMKKVFNKNLKYNFNWAFTFLIVFVSVVLIVIGMLLISLYGHLTC